VTKSSSNVHKSLIIKRLNSNKMKKSLKDTLLLRPKVEIKKSEINLAATEKAVAKIHQAEAPSIPQAAPIPVEVAPTPMPIATPVVTPVTAPMVAKKAVAIETNYVVPQRKNAKSAPSPVPQMEIEQERTKRVTLDIPISMHTEIKMKTFRQSITIREYLLGLAAKDLK
jgi:hypothetical protein